MSRCLGDARMRDSHFIGSCKNKSLPGESYCPECKAKALERVEKVRNDRPRPWPGVARGSRI